MTARWRPLLTWLLLAASGVAGAQGQDPYRLLLPEPPTAVADSPLQRFFVQPASSSLQPLPPDGRASGFVSVDAGSGLSLLCDSSLGVGAALSDLARHCLMGRLDDQGWTLGRVDQVSVGGTLALEEQGLPVDLDFGLSWLRNEVDIEQQAEFGLIDPRYAPSAGIAADLAGESVHLGATHWVSERSWLRVTGRGSRFRVDRLLPSGPLRWNSRSLRLDAGMGNFAGSVTGRETSLPQLHRSWFDLDVGVSWRTPWSARVTVGARNLLSPADALSPELNAGNEPLIESRTPYVRYQQDL